MDDLTMEELSTYDPTMIEYAVMGEDARKEKVDLIMGLLAEHGDLATVRAKLPEASDALHGGDDLTEVEEALCDMPAEDGTLETMVDREIRKRAYKTMAIRNSFPNMLLYDDAVFWSGAIKTKSWYERQDEHPAMSQGKTCFEDCPKLQTLYQFLIADWKAGKRHNGRMIPTIITVVRTPLIFPLLAALRYRLSRSKITAKIEAVCPDGIHQIARFRRGEVDILILPVQLGLVSDLKFCQKMYHFEVISNLITEKEVEGLAFEKSQKVMCQTMTEWGTPFDNEVITKLQGKNNAVKRTGYHFETIAEAIGALKTMGLNV